MIIPYRWHNIHRIQLKPSLRKRQSGWALYCQGHLHCSQQRLGVLPLKQIAKTEPIQASQSQASQPWSACGARFQFAGSRSIFTYTVWSSLKHFPSSCPEEINPWHTFWANGLHSVSIHGDQGGMMSHIFQQEICSLTQCANQPLAKPTKSLRQKTTLADFPSTSLELPGPSVGHKAALVWVSF